MSRKIALVIGNNEYNRTEKLSRLRQCVNDARLVCSTLEGLDFDVTKFYRNLTNSELKQALMDFGEHVVKQNDIVLFYFAGHAGEQENDNYLFGIDAEPYKKGENDDKMTMDGVRLFSAILYLQRRVRRKIILITIIDACRVKPSEMTFFHRSVAQNTDCSNLSARILQSVAPEDVGVGQTEIFFSCSPGQIVIEKDGQDNGYFAEALAECIVQPKSWSEVVTMIKRKIIELSDNQQLPQSVSKIYDFIYFAGQEVRGGGNQVDLRKLTQLTQVLESQRAVGSMVRSYGFSQNCRLDIINVVKSPQSNSSADSYTRLIDNKITVGMVDMVVAIANLDTQSRSWTNVKQVVEQFPVEQTKPEVKINDNFPFKQKVDFLLSGDPDQQVVSDIQRWYSDIITDADILESTKVDLLTLAEIVAATGVRVRNVHSISKDDQTIEQTVVEIGFIRYPYKEYPQLKVYRLEFKSRSYCERQFWSQVDDNKIECLLHVVTYKLLDLMQEE